MDDITDIDQQLSPVNARIVAAATSIDFAFICELPNLDVVAAQTYKGVYKIDIFVENLSSSYADWVEEFRNEWDHPSFHGRFTCTTKDKRIKRHGALSEWMPLYIGKSKKVGQRIKEHWGLPMAARTFALKISERENMKNRRFRLGTIPLHVTNYDFIAPVFERALRDRFNPLVGKQ